ncbi:cytochrome b-c1 complex subunit 6, mitochondrial-like [Phymastichus coffea]|uniref:cytochrome b-c1 complex subunit 6, mitochondrial-like n=1 Tax=Phymastichus coffea TaxID=108790 RepID=UPI00273C179C|nr:cytochrome b-c1 complex subunit 6, mitochondrial-like [Phymastichus coffea]
MSSSIWSFIQSFVPTVKAEDEDEGELVDPQKILREKCKETKKCQDLENKLNTCNDRVNSRSQTTETCVEEVIDFMSCIDHCAAKTLFHHLK